MPAPVDLGELERRVAVFESLGDDEETVLAYSALVDAYADAGRLDEMAFAFGRMVAICEGHYGFEHPQTLSASRTLAEMLGNLGRDDESIALYERILPAAEGLLDSRDVNSLRADLAELYFQADRPAEAVPLRRRRLADFTASFGPDEPATLMAAHELAAVLEDAGSLAEAITVYEGAVAGRERVLGKSHPDTIRSRNNLGYTYGRAGRVQESIDAYRRTLAEGTEADEVLRCTFRNNLADALHADGQNAESITLYERTLDIRNKLLGRFDGRTLTCAHILAGVYADEDRYDRAAELLEWAADGRTRNHGPDHMETVASRHNLAAAYISLNRPTEAVPILRDCLATCIRVLAEDAPDTQTVRETLAHALESLG